MHNLITKSLQTLPKQMVTGLDGHMKKVAKMRKWVTIRAGQVSLNEFELELYSHIKTEFDSTKLEK